MYLFAASDSVRAARSRDEREQHTSSDDFTHQHTDLHSNSRFWVSIWKSVFYVELLQT